MKLDLSSAIEEISKNGGKRILLQLPDGLKPDVFSYFTELSKHFSVIVTSEAFYGACDIGSREVYDGVDYIVQLGHSEIPNIEYPKPVIFIEKRIEKFPEIPDSAYGILKEKGYTNIGLLCSIQYLDMMYEVQRQLERLGFRTVIGKQDRRMKYPGQVLGCNFSAAHSISGQVDCYLVVSTGKFHGIGTQLSSDKPVFILDLNLRGIEDISGETDRFLRRRYARIFQARDARRVLVVVDSKIGQYRMRLAETIMAQARAMGIEPVLIVANEAKPSDFENMMCDAVVFTGCPRVPIDEEDKFSMPVLTPQEFQMVFGIKKSPRYVMDEIVAVDQLN
ncbi:MAG: diphthamide biosynthesis enzyme Dph2 [Candidatus Thermoplasmatota archaeon]|nr:diphthamide biosynthesis enzyme Dph2 [Candidatus Thermoplasmatota archaeon]